MAMSLPVQVAIHNSIYTSAVAASRNSSSSGDAIPVEVCETCGQVIEAANNYSAEEIIFYIVVILIAIWGAYKIADWIIWH